MQLAPTSTAATTVRTTPTEAVPAHVLSTPAGQLYHAHGHDLAVVPGIHSIEYSTVTPNLLVFQYNSYMDAQIAAGLFEPNVHGVQLSFRVGGEEVPAPEHGDAGQAVAQLRAIRAMRGVWDGSYVLRSPYQSPNVVVRATTPEIATSLDALVRDELGFGWTPGGDERVMRLRWVPGIA